MTKITLKFLMLLFAATAAASAADSAQQCITDSEPEAALGDQIKSGAFTLDTSKLGDRPLCSRLPLGRAVQ